MISILRQRSLRYSFLLIQKIRSKLVRNPKYKHFYFAYGANLSIERFKKYNLFAKEVAVAKLPKHQLQMSLPCEYLNKGFAGVELSESHDVWGMVFQLDLFSLWILDILEWAWFGAYKRKKKTVTWLDGTTQDVWCYVVQSPRSGLKCSERYNLLLTAAKNKNFPQDYIQDIQSFETQERFELDHSVSLRRYAQKRRFYPRFRIVYKIHDGFREKLCRWI